MPLTLTSAPPDSSTQTHPLLREVAGAYLHLTDQSLNHSLLRDLTRDHGVDFGTALLYDRIRRSPRHGPFICEIDSIDPDLPPAQLSGKLLVAPAAFYREHPRFGGDGALIRQTGSLIGLQTQMLPVASTGSVSKNADAIAHLLSREPERSVILASLSKGGADVRIALEKHPRIASKIRLWLNICGLVRGTPISNSLLGTRWWQRGLLKGYLAYTRADAEFVSELAGTPGSLLGRPLRIGENIRIINVVAFPLGEHLTGNSIVRHQRLAHLGPNDGSTLLLDSIIESGLVYPVWGADHFLRTPAVPSLIHRLLVYCARSL